MLHRYELNGMKIVIDVASGAIHIVDELTWDILEQGISDDSALVEALKGKYAVPAILEALDELKALDAEGLLNAADSYEEKVLSEKRAVFTKALCLNIAHDCNIRCGYCFASTGNYHGGRKLMPLEVAKEAIDFLLATSGSRKRLEVDFFGGEPLLNFDVVRETVAYAREKEKAFGKRIGFTMTTNGTLMDEAFLQFADQSLDNVVVSIDGRKSVNDKMRKFVDGAGTFDAILPKIKTFVESRGAKSYYIRGTFTANNLDFCEDVLLLAEEGFKEISIEPVVAEQERSYALKEEHLDRIYAEYERLAGKYIEYQEAGKGFRFYHFLMDLDGGPCVYKRVSSCGSGVEYFAVTPDGELYPCHQFVGKAEYRMGDIRSGVTNQEMQKAFSENTVYHKEKCRSCWARFYCSGGCQANAAVFNGDLKKPYELECKLQQKRIECAIMLKAYQALKENK